MIGRWAAVERLSFGSKVLFAQYFNCVEDEFALRDTQILHDSLFAYDQLEYKTNMRHYKNVYGIDLAHEVQKSLERNQFYQHLNLIPQEDGYMALAQFENKEREI